MSKDLSEQPARVSSCPECGSDASADSLRRHHLSALGYSHDDQVFDCSECDNSYTHGVPVGEFDGAADDLWCDVCDRGYMRIHRVRVGEDSSESGAVGLDLKCAHHSDFDCPHCGQHIGSDGVQPTPAGTRVCPYCQEYIPREDVPYCHYFDQTSREVGERGIALLGFPMNTGALNPDEPYGFASTEGDQ